MPPSAVCFIWTEPDTAATSGVPAGEIRSTPSWLRPPDRDAPHVSLYARAPWTGHTSPARGGAVSGEVVIDGSSTVEPLSSAAGELFKEENPDANVTVGTSGTGGGFEKFCRGETDISDASRAIKDEEAAACEAEGIGYTELLVANDALTVVVNAENDFVTGRVIEVDGGLRL